jgi:hypothetical protein
MIRHVLIIKRQRPADNPAIPTQQPQNSAVFSHDSQCSSKKSVLVFRRRPQQFNKQSAPRVWQDNCGVGSRLRNGISMARQWRDHHKCMIRSAYFSLPCSRSPNSTTQSSARGKHRSPSLGRGLFVLPLRSNGETDGPLRDAELARQLPLGLHCLSQRPPIHEPSVLRQDDLYLGVGERSRSPDGALARGSRQPVGRDA